MTNWASLGFLGFSLYFEYFVVWGILRFLSLTFGFIEEFVAHSSTVNCLKIGRKSSRVLVTGGEDHKVNLWAIGKPNAILVCSHYSLILICFHVKLLLLIDFHSTLQ